MSYSFPPLTNLLLYTRYSSDIDAALERPHDAALQHVEKKGKWRKRVRSRKRRKRDSWKKGTLEKNVASVIRVLATTSGSCFPQTRMSKLSPRTPCRACDSCSRYLFGLLLSQMFTNPHAQSSKVKCELLLSQMFTNLHAQSSKVKRNQKPL